MMITRSAELAPLDRAGAPAPHTDADRSVSDVTRRRIIDAVPPNTTRAYARQRAAFTTWCATHGRAPLPATGETLTEYVAHLADAGRAPATADQWRSYRLTAAELPRRILTRLGELDGAHSCKRAAGARR